MMNIHRLGTQRHNHCQRTLQLKPFARHSFNSNGTLARVELDFYGYFCYWVVRGDVSVYWCGPLDSFTEDHPVGYWEIIK